MSKNAIHNFNLSIKNSADIKSSEHLAKAVIEELAKVSKEMSQQKDIAQIWQEQKSQNVTALARQSSTPTEGGATNTSAETSDKATVLVSTTTTVSEGTIANPTASTGGGATSLPALSGTTPSVTEATIPTSNAAPTEDSIADATGGTEISSPVSDNIIPPLVSTTEKSASILSSGTTAQTYAAVAAQEILTVPQTLQENTTEPTLELVKATIKKKLETAIAEKNSAAIEYWTKVSTAFEKGATAKDFEGKPDDILFTEMYAELIKSNAETTVEIIQNFNWETLREKMIAAIDANILEGKIAKESKERWKTIRKQLNDDKTNIANLFEQYDELFLLLKEVEGLNGLPEKISITSKTKIYPNLSADKVYAAIGREEVYAFLKEVSNKEIQGSAVNKGAVKINNTEATSFIVGESLEFILDQAFINENRFQKENINWVVYKNKTDKGMVFANEGTAFSYNFQEAGTYKVEAYGTKKGANHKKSAKTSAFVELKIIVQEIEITPPASIKNGFTRAATEEQLFKVALKNPEVKTINPLQLYYQIENTNDKGATIITDQQLLDPTAIVKLTMPNLGNYTIKINSKDQYGLNQKQEIKAIKNYVSSIHITKGNTENNIYLLSDTNQSAIFAAKTFIIEPATPQEKANIKWLVYDKNGKILIPDNFLLKTEDNVTEKPFLTKGETFIFLIPKKEGDYTVEAYSNSKDGLKSKSSKKICVLHPQVTEAYWTDASGTPKTTSGFIGETNYVNATIPNFCNKDVRIYFQVKECKNTTYHKNRYFIDTKTDSEGKINAAVNFSKDMKTKLIINNWNVNLKFAFVGIVDNQSYPFKGATYPKANAELKVTTKKEILDLYFDYQGKRVTETDRVLYDHKKAEMISLIAKTRNMVGEKLTFTAHGLGKPNVLGKLGETKVDNNGVATVVLFTSTIWESNSIFDIQKGKDKTFYAGVDGFSTKDIENKTLVLEVGTKWDAKIDNTNEDLHEVLTIIGKTRLKSIYKLTELEKNIQKYIDSLKITIKDNKVNSPLKLAHFLSQLMHESGELRWTEEGGVSDDAYGGFKGRGLIQLTGKTNYTNYGNFVKDDVTSSLENKIKLEKNPHAAKSAGWFWNKVAELNDDAERNDFIFITFVVNGGLNGYNERLNFLKNAFKSLNISNGLDYKFKDSKAYNNLKYSFGWGLWHDSSTSKIGCTKENSTALIGYERFIELHDKNGKKTSENNWYGYNKENIRSFVENRIKEIKNE
jgi:predicted chitinase